MMTPNCCFAALFRCQNDDTQLLFRCLDDTHCFCMSASWRRTIAPCASVGGKPRRSNNFTVSPPELETRLLRARLQRHDWTRHCCAVGSSSKSCWGATVCKVAIASELLPAQRCSPSAGAARHAPERVGNFDSPLVPRGPVQATTDLRSLRAVSTQIFARPAQRAACAARAAPGQLPLTAPAPLRARCARGRPCARARTTRRRTPWISHLQRVPPKITMTPIIVSLSK